MTPPLYNPEAFRIEDADRLANLVERLRFGTLVSNGTAGPIASHAPFLLDRRSGPKGTLLTHLARANGHWSTLDGEAALVMFQTADHYVSPAWYASKRRTGKVVPTWNYVAVHARGTARTFVDRGRLLALVEQLTEQMEGGRAEPWRVSDAPADYIDMMLGHIVGVAIEIEQIEGKLKLGQNRSQSDRDSLAAAIDAERPDLARTLEALSAE